MVRERGSSGDDCLDGFLCAEERCGRVLGGHVVFGAGECRVSGMGSGFGFAVVGSREGEGAVGGMAGKDMAPAGDESASKDGERCY